MAGWFDTMFGGGAEKEAAEKNRQLYQQYGTDANGYLDRGLYSSLDALNEARNAYAPLSALASKYGQGTDMYLNALGLNGSAGSTAAQNAFTTGPGYQQGIDAGIDVLNRRRAAAGMLDSGNADQDAQVFGQNLQNQQWNNWLSNLSGLNNNALSATGAAAGGIAGVNTNVANTYGTDATNRVGVAGNVASGNANANALQAQGEAAGAKNLLGAGLSLATLGAGGGMGSMLGGLGGGSGLGSSLGSLGITYGMPGTRNSNLYGPVAP